MQRLVFAFLVLVFCSFSAQANIEKLEQLLTAREAPPGVVIEILTKDAAGLEWALPLAQDYIRKLRLRFAELPIVIVSHGREEFALMRNQAKKQHAAHQLAKQIKQDNNVQIHVCGTHAEWYRITPEDFPEYINVSASGPAQINDYVSLGYQVLLIDAH